LVWFGSSVWGVVLGGIARVGFSHRESASPYTPDPLLILVLVSRAELEKEKNNDKKNKLPFLFVCSGFAQHTAVSLSLALSLSREMSRKAAWKAGVGQRVNHRAYPLAAPTREQQARKKNRTTADEVHHSMHMRDSRVSVPVLAFVPFASSRLQSFFWTVGLMTASEKSAFSMLAAASSVDPVK
jgi:hypothetical protein